MQMTQRTFFIIMFLLSFLQINAQKQKDILNTEVKTAMMKATRFMVEKVSNKGGYLWNYSPDFSRCWGELEAKPSMIWLEAGTPAMGNIFLDAYHATENNYYLKAAESAANAVIWSQQTCGGWPYMVDYAGEASLKDWYKKVAKGYIHCAQEHLHYYGNCTYDDAVTYDAVMFLIRMYLETMDAKYKYAVDKCIDFVLQSQYPIGGWPQRYPLHYEFTKGGKADYTSFITLNDGVHTNNINFLLTCYTMLGETRVLEPIQRAMTCIIALQGGKPQAGWAMQHQLDLNYSPGHARDFEPQGYAATATAEMCRNLMRFYRWTGDSKYLARIPDAIDFLESIKYSDNEIKQLGKQVKEGQILCPTFVEVGTNKPLYLHNDDNHYWVDYDYRNLIKHYSSTRYIDINSLKKEYQEILLLPKEDVIKDSPFNGETATQKNTSSIFSRNKMKEKVVGQEEITNLLNVLNNKNYWPGRLPGVSNENPGFSNAQLPKEVISIKNYMNNMTLLISYLENKQKQNIKR